MLYATETEDTHRPDGPDGPDGPSRLIADFFLPLCQHVEGWGDIVTSFLLVQSHLFDYVTEFHQNTCGNNSL